MARPRAFDEEQALEQAMVLFWRHGYEGTSVADLTLAMGLNRPSLYLAFGNKETLFRRAVERYLAGPAARVSEALDLPTGREVVAALLRFYAEATGSADRPPGCLLVNGALRCGAETEPIRRELAAHRSAAVDALRKRLERAQRDGELPDDANPAALAHYVWAILQGMAVQASGGATRKQLQQVAAQALRLWPAELPGRST